MKHITEPSFDIVRKIQHLLICFSFVFIMRKVFGFKRDKVTGHWRKLHNEELHNLYFSPAVRIIISRKMRMGGACRTHREIKNVYKIVVGMSESKSLLERPRHR
jgi:hypothetical protein